MNITFLFRNQKGVTNVTTLQIQTFDSKWSYLRRTTLQFQGSHKIGCRNLRYDYLLSKIDFFTLVFSFRDTT